MPSPLKLVLCLLSSLLALPLTAVPANEFEDVSFLGHLSLLRIAQPPGDGSRVYAISDGRHLLRSDDGGSTFSGKGLIRDSDLFEILAAGRDADEIYLTKSTDEILHSRDGGRSAAPFLLPPGAKGLWLDPREPERLFSATQGRGLWVLEPGRPWAELPPIDPGIPDLQVLALAFDPRTAGHLLAGGSGAIYESFDDGHSWIRRLEAGVWIPQILFDPVRPGVVWAVQHTGDYLLWRSNDGGASWFEVTVPFREWSIALAFDPARPGYLTSLSRARHGSTTSLVFSRDGGASWQNVGLFGDALFFPLQDGRWLVQHGGNTVAGTFFSADLGASWRERKVLPSRVRALALDPEDPDHAWAADDSGVFRTTSGGARWTPVFAPDVELGGPRLLADPEDNRIVYLAHSRLAAGPFLWRSRDRGRTWDAVLRSAGEIRIGGLVAGRRGRTPFTLLSVDEVGSGYRLWRSTDHGESWTFHARPTAGDLAADRQDGTVYQLASPLLERSFDGGLSFSPIEDFSPLQPLRVVAGSGHALHVLAEAPEFPDSFHLFELLPGHAPAGRRLPGGATCFPGIFEPGTLPGQLYISQSCGSATTRGFWWSQDGGRGWTELWRGLPAGELAGLAAGKGGVWVWPADYGIFRGAIENDPRLTLQAHRFEVAATFRDEAGRSRQAQPADLTRQTGTFSFETPGRAELAVKVLDGRPLTGAWWVFYASLSGHEFDLEVVDTVTGESRSYHHAAGTLASFGDIGALPDPPLAGRSAGVEPAAPLLAGRFEARVDWRDFTGTFSGTAEPSPLDDTNFSFSFFWPDNVELLVRLDGDGSAGDPFRLSFAALTNVEYSLELRDIVTGQEWTFFNPLGQFGSRSELLEMAPLGN